MRWYVAYPLSLRDLEAMVRERGVLVEHSTIHRWLIKVVPMLKEAFRKRKRKGSVGHVGRIWSILKDSACQRCDAAQRQALSV